MYICIKCIYIKCIRIKCICIKCIRTKFIRIKCLGIRVMDTLCTWSFWPEDRVNYCSLYCVLYSWAFLKESSILKWRWYTFYDTHSEAKISVLNVFGISLFVCKCFSIFRKLFYYSKTTNCRTLKFHIHILYATIHS